MPKTEQARKQPMGFTPLIEYVRVRTPSGIPSTDENGQARLDPNGAVVWSQRGELLASSCSCPTPAKRTSL
jgi:hypothetical protein